MCLYGRAPLWSLSHGHVPPRPLPRGQPAETGLTPPHSTGRLSAQGAQQGEARLVHQPKAV